MIRHYSITLKEKLKRLVLYVRLGIVLRLVQVDEEKGHLIQDQCQEEAVAGVATVAAAVKASLERDQVPAPVQNQSVKSRQLI